MAPKWPRIPATEGVVLPHEGCFAQRGMRTERVKQQAEAVRERQRKDNPPVVASSPKGAVREPARAVVAANDAHSFPLTQDSRRASLIHRHRASAEGCTLFDVAPRDAS